MLIIDGHNLVPKVRGLSLRELDDEEQLAAILQNYARVKRKKIEVFFDGAQPGQPAGRQFGAVHAHFIQAGNTADEAIRQYVAALGKTARNVTVVSSDRQVQANARALHARVRSSEEFARELDPYLSEINAPRRRAKGSGSVPSPSSAIPPGAQPDITRWLDLFGIDPAQADTPIEPTIEKPPARKTPAPKKPCGAGRTDSKHPQRHGFPKKSA